MRTRSRGRPCGRRLEPPPASRGYLLSVRTLSSPWFALPDVAPTKTVGVSPLGNEEPRSEAWTETVYEPDVTGTLTATLHAVRNEDLPCSTSNVRHATTDVPTRTRTSTEASSPWRPEIASTPSVSTKRTAFGAVTFTVVERPGTCAGPTLLEVSVSVPEVSTVAPP